MENSIPLTVVGIIFSAIFFSGIVVPFTHICLRSFIAEMAPVVQEVVPEPSSARSQGVTAACAAAGLKLVVFKGDT